MWNKGSVKPDQTHVDKGWTGFLAELAPLSIFNKTREPDSRTEAREKLLAQIYELVKLEELYKTNELGLYQSERANDVIID